MCAPGSKEHHAVIDMLRKWFVLAAAVTVGFLSWMHQLIAYQVVILLENLYFFLKHQMRQVLTPPR